MSKSVPGPGNVSVGCWGQRRENELCLPAQGVSPGQEGNVGAQDSSGALLGAQDG